MSLSCLTRLPSKGGTVKQVCRLMDQIDAKWGSSREDGTIDKLRANWTVIDPSSKNRNNQTGRSDQQEFFDNGVSTIPGQNAVGAGINRVKERLDANRLSVCANCVETLSQFRRYRWVKDDGRGEKESQGAARKEGRPSPGCVAVCGDAASVEA